MPLKLIPPRSGKTDYWYVRGSYIGVAIDRSTKATEKRAAKLVHKRWAEEIERGEYRDPRTSPEPIAPKPLPVTFLGAAAAYLKAGGSAAHLSPIIEMAGEHALRDVPIAAIDQARLDHAAAALYPNATPQTRNRQFYTPVAAVLHHAGIEKRFRRPIGWKGSKATSWLEPGQAFALFRAADVIDREFGLFLRFLLYTGMRLSEALAVRVGQIDLKRQFLYVPKTKNREPRAVYLPAVLVQALRRQPPRPARPRASETQTLPNGAGGRSRVDAGVPFLKRSKESRLFRFHAGGALRDMLNQAKGAAGITLPRRQGGFHVFCHSYGTWMRRYGSLDTYGLTRTGRWKDPASADRYSHTEVSSESRQAALLPVESQRKSRRRSVE
jgi:integrase